MTKAEQIKILKQVMELFGNEVNCEDEIEKILSSVFKCPKCDGVGYIQEKYNAYPSNLPDSGWGEDWKYRNVKCSLCNGEGYTEHEYKPIYETKIIGYE